MKENNNTSASGGQGASVRKYAAITPDHFDHLMLFIDSFVSQPAMINLDINDVISLLHLDMENKGCRSGQLQAIEFSCCKNEIENCISMAGNLSGCNSCLILVTMDMAYTLMEIEEMLDILRERSNENMEAMIGIQLKEEGTETIDVCIICNGEFA